MTLQKTIEILKGQPGPQFILQGEEAFKACQLGIEALKWRLLLEHDYGSWCGTPLPGETKD